MSLAEYCVKFKKEHLLEQWDDSRNSVTPEAVTYGSNCVIWWNCEQGHQWQAKVKSRTSGTTCPVCSNRLLLPGHNDLSVLYPEVAKQWHPEKNGALRPEEVAPGSRQKVWWICENGHSWQAAVVSRCSNGTGCPVCAGKNVVPGENDLASLFPDVAAQWHPEKNGVLRPESVTAYSNRKVWWLCELGHAYMASVAHRTREISSCPYCADRKVMPGFNDLETREPDVAAQWHPTLNGMLTPQMVTAGSKKKVWWICAEGHVWKAVVYSRTGAQKSGCPVCAGNVRKDRQNHYAALQTGNHEHMSLLK